MSPRRAVRAAPAAFVLFLLLAVATPARAQQTISLGDYWARLNAARVLAQEGVETPSPEAMDGVRGALGFPVAVQTGTEVVIVQRDPLLTALTGETGGDFRRALARIDALRASVHNVSTAPDIDGDRVDAALSDAYAHLHVPGVGLRDRFGAWLEGAIVWLFSHLFSFDGAATIVTWIVVALLVAALVFVVGKTGLGRDLRVGLVSERSARRDEKTPGQDWLVEADRALAAGDLDRAVRALYRALLAALQARGVIEDAPSVTAGETRLAVAASRPALAPVVGQATTVFERVAYGGAEADAADVEAVRTAERSARSE